MPGKRCAARIIKAIGLILDSFHTFAGQADLTGLRDIPGSCIFLAHLADATAIHPDLLAQNRHFTNFPGQGELPLLEFMEALQATGFERAPVAGNLQ